MLKIPISLLFSSINALFCNRLPVLHTFSLQFWPKLSTTISILWNFRCCAPIFHHLSAVCQDPQTLSFCLLLLFYLAVPSMTLASIDSGFWPNSLYFGLPEHSWKQLLSQLSPFLGLNQPFSWPIQSPFTLFQYNRKSVDSLVIPLIKKDWPLRRGWWQMPHDYRQTTETFDCIPCIMVLGMPSPNIDHIVMRPHLIYHCLTLTFDLRPCPTIPA